MKNGIALFALLLLTACGGGGSTGSLIPVASAPVPTQSSAPSNDLVINGSFAQGNVDWTQSGNVAITKETDYDSDGWDDAFTGCATTCYGTSDAAVNVPTAGSHKVHFRYASDYGCSVAFQVQYAGGNVWNYSTTMPLTMGGWTSYDGNLSLPAGTNTIRFGFNGSNCTAKVDEVVIN